MKKRNPSDIRHVYAGPAQMQEIPTAQTAYPLNNAEPAPPDLRTFMTVYNGPSPSPGAAIPVFSVADGKSAVYCASCGTKFEDGAKFCGECGSFRRKYRCCAKCGSKLDAFDVYCSECGKKA